MKKLTNKLGIKIAILMLATISTLVGYSQDTYNFRELLLDNEGNIFTVRPDEAWENTSEADLPKVLEKVYKVNDVELRKLSSEKDGEFIFTKWQQQYSGIDVFGGDIIVKSDLAGKIILINGCLRKVALNYGSKISADSALVYAMRNIGLDQEFFWEQAEVVDAFAKKGTDTSLLGKPKPELKYYMKNDDLGGDFILCYEFHINTMAPAEYEVFVDAYTGEVIGKMNSVHPVGATGATLYVGNVSFTAERKPGLGYILEDSTRKIFGTDWKNGTTDAHYFWDANTVFSDSADKPGVEVHWGMSKTYDYFKNYHNWKSYNNKGSKISNNVNWKTNYNNAYWSNQFKEMFYGMGNDTAFSPLVSLDVVGHEFSHGLIKSSAGLIYRKESGALNEGFADVFGASIEKRVFTNGNWWIGEDCYTPRRAGDALRYMNNPNGRRDPDCYNGTYFVRQTGCIPTGGDTGNDWCGVHTNSGVLNFWYFCLTDGKSGTNDVNNAYSVTGIGLAKSEKIAFRALTKYMNTTTDFKAARIATLQAAEDLYGKKSNEYKQVCNAWYAVNVGEKCCPDSMELEFKFTKPKCHDSKDGKIELTIKKADGPFTYEWYKNDTLGPVISMNKDLTGVGKGDYWIWVRDTMAKCEKVEKTKLEAPEKVSVSIAGGGVHIRACDRRPEIFLQATASGGTSPFTYNWPNGKKVVATSGSVGNSGWYTSIATDKNGCKGRASAFVFFIPIRCSYDPNDIIGPPSYGDDKWVSVKATLPYKVRFENDPKFATAPAQKVTIDHPLDTNTDMASFRLKDFGFANFNFTVPINSSYYSKRLDLRDSLGIYLDVTAGLDLSEKKAFWIFESIDPNTGLPPDDANVGFLAVNDTNTHVGEGYVDYTIKPRSDANTGDSIRAQADIVFDNNPALLTPKIHNLIDAVAPTSGVRSLPSLQDSVNIPITMYGTDDVGGSGMGAWDLYVSENGGAFTQYAQGLTDSLITYRGNYGSEYRFYTLGLDNVSNKEKAKTVADVTVTIAPDQFLHDLDSNLSLCAFDTLEIKWNFLNIPSFDLEYTADSGASFISLKKGLSPSDSIYNWIIPSSISGKKDYWIRAVAGISGTPIDTSRFFELKDVPDLNLGPDTNFCVGTTFSLLLNSGGANYSSYLWSNSSTSKTITASSVGTYSLTATNTYGCSSTDEIVIGNYLLPVVSNRAITNATCFGASDGQVLLTVVSGNAPYKFNWSSGDTTQDLFSKKAGTYIVSITDSVNCSINDTTVISEPALLKSSPIVKNVSCFNGSDAEIDLNTAGGTAPYTYLWSNTDTTETITGLTKGTYTVVTTDANNCTTYDTITVTEPTLLTASGSKSDVSCFGGSDGSITLTVSGGTTNYTYLWSNAATSKDLTSLSKGTYSVIVTDANNCLAYDTVTVNEPTQLVSSTSITNVSCNAGNDGAVDLTVSGGTTSYSYLWSNSATTQDISSLVAGTYIVTITDANNCVLKDTAIVTQPTALAISNSVTDVSCNGGNDGEVDITVTGGTTAYTYLWSNSATTQDITNLVAGTYTVVVTDANNCVIRDTGIVSQPTALTSSASLTMVKCKDGNDGAIDLTVSGGTTSYSYLWSNSATTQDLSNLSAGTYDVRITDGNGCIHRDTFVITEPSQLASSIADTNISCNGLTDGIIDLTVTGGTAPYTYAWSNSATSQDLSSLAKGTYTVLITDDNGCTLRDTSIITEPTKLTISGVVSNVKCNAGSDGGVVLTVGGGTTAYTYLWSNTSTNKDLSNVVKGTYNVLVTDANSCIIRDTFTITEPTALTISNSSKDVSCNKGSDGTASVTVGGGTSPYTYLWSNSETTSSINGLSAGTYTVVVTDANACIIRDTVEIKEPTALVLSKQVDTISCFGQTDGRVIVSMTGGVGPYTYLWSNSSTNDTISNLSKGSYSVIVTDDNGCKYYDTTQIIEPAILASTGVITNVSCNGGSDGAVDLTVTGGTTPYQYLWSTTSTNQDVSGLPMVTVSVIITDNNGCVHNDTFNITEPTALVKSAIVTHVLCNGDTTGAVDFTLTGGTAPYKFAWSNGDTTEDIINLKAGKYLITATDANLCEVKDSFTINEPPLLQTSSNAFDATCFGANDGTAITTVSGGVKPYKFLWSDGDTNALNGNLIAGTYSVIITDANNCQIFDTVKVNEPTKLVLTKTVTPVKCNQGFDGAIDITIAGGTPNYTFLWSNTAITEDLNSLSAGTYSVIVKDDNGCELFDTSDVVEPTAIVVSKVPENLKCKNDGSGSIDLTVSGGTPGYSFLWNNFATTEDLTNLDSGSYSVVITDKNNCKAFDTTLITEPDSLLGSLSGVDVKCFGDADGSIDLTVTGGTMPYKYLWSNTDTTEDINGLSGGEYSVIVTDTNNCQWYDTVQIAEPSELVIDLDSIAEIETQKNGKAWVTATGGVGPYTYLWNDPAGSTTDTASNLSRGVYTVTVKDQNGCEKVDSIMVPTVVGIGKVIPSGDIVIYPNPNQGWVGIYNLKDLGDDIKLLVTDANGRTLLEKTIHNKDKYHLELPATLVDGTYLLSIYGNNTIVHRQMILIR